MVGHPYRGLFSIPYAGLDEHGIPQFYTPEGEITSTDINFQNRDNNSYLIYEVRQIPPSLVLSATSSATRTGV